MKKETLSRNLKYFKSFVNKYCHFFKEEGLSLNDIGLELYNQITVDENSIGGNVVKRAFFQSPWFNEYSSKQTNSFVKSDFFYDEKNQYKTQIHEYYEKEKYIEQVEKTGFKMVPYQEQEMQCNYIDPYNPCQYVTVSKSRLDTYTYTKPETRYRDVRREYKYSVKETIQMISSSIETNIFLLGSSIKIPYKNYSQYVKLNHNENKPNIGLSPKVEPLYSKDYVIGSEWDIFYNFIQNELDRIWIGTYCGKNSFVNVDFYFSGEAISACLRSKNGYKVDGVEDWFSRNFNLSREIISSYIK